MTDDEIEREMEGLAPAAPSEALLARLHTARRTRPKIVRFPTWLPLAAAACAVFLFVLLRPGVRPLPAQKANGSVQTFQPVETDRYLLSARDLGVVEISPGRPYRLVHCIWADRETFRSERDAAHLEVRQSREQIVPVALNTL